MTFLSPEALAAALGPTGSVVMATTTRSLDDCIIEGCHGLPAGLPARCYDTNNMSSVGPPVRYKSAGDALICALSAAGTPEGERLIAEAEARRAAARRATSEAQRSSALPYQESRARLINDCRPRMAGWNVSSTRHIYDKDTGWPAVAMFGRSYNVLPNPGNMRCYVFQSGAFEVQRNLARMLKQQLIARRTTMGYLDAIDWAMQATSCAAMTVVALNVNANEAWFRWMQLNRPPPRPPSGAASWPRFYPLYGFNAVQSYTLDEYASIVDWPATASGPTIAGESPAGPGGLVSDIILPQWARRAGDWGSAGQPVTLYGEWINGRDLATKRTELRQRALNVINYQPNLKDSVLAEAELWINWVLSLPDYATIQRGYLDEWIKSATTFDPSNPYGSVPPISAQDYKAVREGTKQMNEQLALSAIQGVAALSVGIGTMNPAIVIGSLSSIVTTLLSEAPRLHELARPIQMPYARWLADGNYSLDAAGPDTQSMMSRLISSLVRYQNDMGINFGITIGGGAARPQDLPPVELPPPPPPPQKSNTFLKAAVIGGAALGAFALVRYLMK